MPLPNPKKDESKSDFVSRCMGSSTMKSEFPGQDQRLAVCHSQWRKKHKGAKPKSNMLHTFTASTTEEFREETFDGKDYLVVPVIALVEGVIHGSQALAPELVLANELESPVEAWNGRPVTLGHPEENGLLLPAGSPRLLENYQIGTIFNAIVEDKKLHVEAWIDLDKIESLGEDALSILERIRDGEHVEVSTGYFVTSVPSDGVFEGRKYEAIQHNIKPDHLAILIGDAVGACSWEDGCGVPRLNEAERKEIEIQSVIFPKEHWSSIGACKRWLKTNGFDNDYSRSRGNLSTSDDNFKFHQRSSNEFSRLRTLCMEPDSESSCKVRGIGGPLRKASTVQRFFTKYQDILEFRDNQELSDIDTRAAISAVLEASGEHWFSIAAVFKDYVVYERNFGELFKRGYTISDDGSISLDEEIEAVRPQTEFVSIVINESEEDSQQTEKIMPFEEKISALISNEQTKFVEEDRKFLSGLEEAQLDKLEPILKADPPPVENKELKKVETESEENLPELSAEEYIEKAPKEIKEVLNEGLRMTRDKRAGLIQELTTNKGCDFSAEELKEFSTHYLKCLIKLSGSGSSADYSGRGMPTAGREIEDPNAAPLPIPVFDLSKPSTSTKEVN